MTDPNNSFIQDNLKQVEAFVEQYMPAFVGDFKLNEFRHINPLKKMTLSRNTQFMAVSCITEQTLSLNDTYVRMDTATPKELGTGYLSIEEALDLRLLTAFNPLNINDRKHFNPFMFHFEQCRAQ